MIQKITAVRYQCKCDWPDCAHPWESDEIPERCAKCKRRTWNRPAIRHGHDGKQIEAFGKSQTIAAWGREFKISRANIHLRIKKGWTVEAAISTPVHKKKDVTVDTYGVTEYDPETGCRPNSHINPDGTVKKECL